MREEVRKIFIFKEIDLSEDYDFIEYKAISDTHIGDPYFDDNLLNEDIEWALEKDYRRIILNGDIMNCATLASVSDTYGNLMTPQEELNCSRKIFGRVSDKVDSYVGGNHERRLYREVGFDIGSELALALNCVYSQEGMLLKIKFGKRKYGGKKQVYTLYQTHGTTGSKLVGGKANNLQRLRNIVVADIYVVSHSHQIMSFDQKIFIPDLYNNNIREVSQKFINTGAYLDYGGYGHYKGYYPTKKGTPVIRLYAKEKHVEVIT